MKKMSVVIVCALIFAAGGCDTLGESTKKGAGLGALGGAAAGGIIGHQSGHGWEGALIGGAAGATAGGLIGSQADKRQMEANTNYIPVFKIAEMASSGLPDDVIIGEIDRTKSVYELTSETISYLKDNKVGNKVIDHMLATGQKK